MEWRLIVCICQKDHSIIILSLSKNQLLQKPLSFLDQSNSSHFLSIPVFKLLMVQKGIITVSVLKSTVFLQPHQLPSLYIWSTYKTDPIGFSKVNHGVQSRVLHLLGMNISKMPLMGTRLPSSLVRVIAWMYWLDGHTITSEKSMWTTFACMLGILRVVDLNLSD